ncbi:MAG: hypothetical protein ACOYLQ_10540 [Hyphomicrobiaceae bacterium]
MAIKGRSVLLVCNDIPPDEEAGFNDWYIREHLPERANGLPGFNRGRRYRALYDTPRYLALYETDGPAALTSPEYLALVRDPDPRSRRYIPQFQRASRTILSVTASSGIGEGGVIAILGLRPRPDAETALRDQLAALVREQLPRTPGIVAAHLLEKDADALTASRRGHMRHGDVELSWVLAVEAVDEPAIRALRRDALSRDALAAAGAEAEDLVGVFSLLMTITKGG